MMSKSTSSSDMGDGSQKEGKMDKPAPFPRPQSADFEFYSKWSFPFFEKFRDYSKNPVENPGLYFIGSVFGLILLQSFFFFSVFGLIFWEANN